MAVSLAKIAGLDFKDTITARVFSCKFDEVFQDSYGSLR